MERMYIRWEFTSHCDQYLRMALFFLTVFSSNITQVSFPMEESDISNASRKNTITSNTKPLQQWTQWQLLDSLLPTGGFAHSFGLEAAIQSRLVTDLDTLHSFTIQTLENTASLLLPFVHALATTPDLQTWKKLDQWLDAMLTNEVIRRASTTQGFALLRIAAFAFTEMESLRRMRSEALSLGSGTISFHHAPVFGLVCGAMGMDSQTAQRAYLFVTVRDVISAATRLNVIGPQGGAMLQYKVAFVAEEILRKWMDKDVEDACQTAPMLDTVQGCHSYLFSKMFCS